MRHRYCFCGGCIINFCCLVHRSAIHIVPQKSRFISLPQMLFVCLFACYINNSISYISEKPLDMINKSPSSGPSIMKKRGYEQTNGIDTGR